MPPEIAECDLGLAILVGRDEYALKPFDRRIKVVIIMGGLPKPSSFRHHFYTNQGQS
jgi:hypothetical protein